MKKKSLKFKLIFGGISIVLLPLIIVGFFSVTKSSNALITAGKNQATQVAYDLTSMTELFFNQELKFAEEMAINPLIYNAVIKNHQLGTSASLNELIETDKFFTKSHKKIGDSYELLFISDSHGNTIADNLGGKLRSAKLNISDRDYFKLAKSGKTNISNPVKSKVSGNPITVAAVPILTPNGEFAGMFGSVIKMENLSDIISSVKLGETGYPYITDQTGMIIVHPNKEFILELNLATLKGMERIMDRMTGGETGVDEYHFKGVDKIASFREIPSTGWSLCVTQNKDEFLKASVVIRNLILIVGAGFLVATIFIVIFFANSLILPISRISSGLNKGAEQVASASSELSNSSQSLAEGSAEQAASIEESSSSIEEISSMTKQNADNSKEADSLMKETNTAVNNADSSMKLLKNSMKEISKASDETSTIVKTIDDIAFQTNLLALNAAVEAARAGDAGAGFAVVADEVRSLAMRAAEAAKNTSNKIEGIVKKIEEGSGHVTVTSDALELVAESSGKVGTLVAEISVASVEQSDGVEQVNLGINQMNTVVQQNAATAEESASASEEMSAQAAELNRYVSELTYLIMGDSTEKTTQSNISTNTPQLRHKDMKLVPHV